MVTAMNFAVFGVPILVTREGEAGIETCGIWLTHETDDYPVNASFQRREAKRAMAVSLAEVESVPRGTAIEAPEYCGDDKRRRWKVDGIDRIEADHVRVVLVKSEDA